MITEKWVESWLRLRIHNFKYRIGGKTSYGKIGLKRLRTQLKQIVDQLDGYLEELTKENKRRND